MVDYRWDRQWLLRTAYLVKREARERFQVASFMFSVGRFGGSKFSNLKLETRNPKLEQEESPCAWQFPDKS